MWYEGEVSVSVSVRGGGKDVFPEKATHEPNEALLVCRVRRLSANCTDDSPGSQCARVDERIRVKEMSHSSKPRRRNVRTCLAVNGLYVRK